jgi:secondary thiamine-phosphate synthase enzyme
MFEQLALVSHRKRKAMIFQRRVQISTTGNGDMHDLTEHVTRIVNDSRVASGIVHVFNVGSTAAIGTIEFEPGLCEDLPNVLNRLMPPNREYGHEQMWHDGNGHSHLQATTLGAEITVPISDGALVLGTWQQVFHLECDNKPRQREIVVTVWGE